MADQGPTAHRQAEQSPQAGQDGQQEAPQPQGGRHVLAGHGVSRHPCNGHRDEHRRRDDVGLHRGVAHHQAAQDGHSSSDRRGQPQPRLLEHLEGYQHNQYLKDSREGDLLLGRHDGQGQLHRDGLRVEGHQGDIEPGDKQGGRHAEIAQQEQHRGSHPVEGPVLAGPEELVHGARQQIAEGEAVTQQPHPPLQQPGAEPVRPLGERHQGKGGPGRIGEVLLQVPCRLHPVDVDGVQLLLYPLHRVRVGDPVQIDHHGRGEGLPSDHMLPDLQLRRPQAAADQGGVGEDGLHKGVPGPLQGGLVLRLPHRPLFLCPYEERECVHPPGKEQDTPAHSQIHCRLIQRGAALYI